MRAVVNKIIPFSAVDGPGNRTAVFLQGCNIDCKYCHNPETRGMCIHCGMCVEQCPVKALTMKDGKVSYNEEKCIHCDTCIHICNYDSSPKTMEMTPEEVFEKVKKQMPFIRGITVSGGECTLQPEFLEELFRLCKSVGLMTFIDTNGTNDFRKLDDLLGVTDGVMLDIKAYELEEHEVVTSASNELVLKNAEYLASIGKLYEVRTVVVPELFDAHDTVLKTTKLLKPYLAISDIGYKIIAYRPNGVRKQYAHYTVPNQEYLQGLEKIVREEGFEKVIIL
ncbi:YjjW family glycine radical enzyme activase [Anaeromicropila herbilytica]|uniref:Radical SAM domain protein n=1 Tax=Anaeromicropila herbilytica TaxID=2785025 RepID=A0A7R7EJ34_9FIRM|nr:YjjW family glycine radical enzyme activase [Anaeromicropila herbilytica]BCN30085.1 radical SAM domain protein [Anaeromicropila herbilytica]